MKVEQPQATGWHHSLSKHPYCPASSNGTGESQDRTPVVSQANLPVNSTSATTAQSSYGTSPGAASSEGGSVEITMGEQSPPKLLTQPSAVRQEGPARSTNDVQLKHINDASLLALDRPLDDAVPTKCKFRTGCLNMDCIYAHACPKLLLSQAKYYDLPKTIRDCPDGVLCHELSGYFYD